MQMMRRTMILFAAVALVYGALPALAQLGPALERGELVKVDTTAKAFAIRTDLDEEQAENNENPEVWFNYTEETKVVGADGEVAGLATMAGVRVLVAYVYVDKVKTATEIRVAAKEQQGQE